MVEICILRTYVKRENLKTRCHKRYICQFVQNQYAAMRWGVLRVLGRSLASAASNGGEMERMVKAAPVVVFMKGTPAAPRCGFSNAVVQVLRLHDVKYDSHDVLADDNIRQGNL